jgi:hypothetical protein
MKYAKCIVLGFVAFIQAQAQTATEIIQASSNAMSKERTWKSTYKREGGRTDKSTYNRISDKGSLLVKILAEADPKSQIALTNESGTWILIPDAKTALHVPPVAATLAVNQPEIALLKQSIMSAPSHATAVDKVTLNKQEFYRVTIDLESVAAAKSGDPQSQPLLSGVRKISHYIRASDYIYFGYEVYTGIGSPAMSELAHQVESVATSDSDYEVPLGYKMIWTKDQDDFRQQYYAARGKTANNRNN